jgi:hypothetical protein
LRELSGLCSRARGLPLDAKREFEAAIKAARAAKLDNVVHDVAYELATQELEQHDVSSAKNTIAESSKLGVPDDPVQHTHQAIVLAEIAVEERRFDDAIAILDDARRDAKNQTLGELQAVRGRALLSAHRLDDAEAALRDAAEHSEAARADLGFDALKPWLMASERRPLEDLFVLYASQHRNLDAFAIAQRATARSILDGIVTTAAPAHTTFVADLEGASTRVDALRQLTHAVKSSAAAQPPSTETLLARLHDLHVISYFSARDELWLIDLAPNGALQILDLGANTTISDAIHGQSQALGSILLPPSISIAPNETLYIVVDDPIRDVAFAALAHDGDYLIHDHAIVYEPSAAVLAVLADRSTRSAAPVVIGDPTSNLEGARQEAIEIAGHMRVHPLLGAAATRAAVLTTGGAAVLHVASHTVATIDGRALQMADGTLSSGDILDHGIDAGTVVLASCASADALTRGELTPLASSFLAAGAHTVVGSRWSVKDVTALAFARAFYEAHGATDPVGATAVAQRQLIRQGVPATEWSTFVVIGRNAPGGER